MRTGRAVLLALSLALLVTGAAGYAFFAKHVADRGDGVIREKWDSKEARQPLTLGVAGIGALAASGIVGLVALRGARGAPLAGLGLPLACGGAVGLLAFEAGPGVFVAASAIVGCFVACALAAVAWGRPVGAAWRVMLHSWMTVGTLVTLAILAFGALGVLEKQLPRIPWSAILASIALTTLMRGMARHVAAAGQDPMQRPLRHQQVRTPLETPAIHAVAGQLHPFIEQGRGGAAYDALAGELAQRVGLPAPARVPGTPGPRLPAGPAALAGLLRAASFALPLGFLLPGLWGLAVPLLLAGMFLPPAGASLLAKGEPLGMSWWLAGAGLAAAGAYLAALLVTQEPTLALAGAAVALPYLGLALWARRRPLPEEVAFLRAGHARHLADRTGQRLMQGLAVAGAFLVLPLVLLGIPLLIGVALPQVPWQVVAAGATGGAAWALAGLTAGRAAALAASSLDGAQARQEAARRAAHVKFLDRLEAT